MVGPIIPLVVGGGLLGYAYLRGRAKEVERERSMLEGCIEQLPPPSTLLSSVGMFAGAGGFELGLSRAGFSPQLLVEWDEGATAILNAHWPEVKKGGDVYALDAIPDVSLLAAGFPCKDIALCGRKEGIMGPKSSAVTEVFRVIEANPPEWVLIENVPRILEADAGYGMEYLIESFERLGYNNWAFRVVDLRAFGIPQRRCRFFMLASRTHDPRGALLTQEAGTPWSKCMSFWESRRIEASPYGVTHLASFAVSSGTTGAGWAENGVSTLTAGSSRGQPQPRAIWDRSTGLFWTPSILDAERLQGFPANWTQPAEAAVKPGFRWTYVGNAVPPVIGHWLGNRIRQAKTVEFDASTSTPRAGRKWSVANAGWAMGGEVHYSPASARPVQCPYWDLHTFLQHPLNPLRKGEGHGFLSRARKGRLSFAGNRKALFADLDVYLEQLR